MKIIIVAISLFVAALVSDAAAQTSVSVDLNKAVLSWEWTKGAPPNDGDATEFVIKCGQTSKTYTKLTSVAGNVRSAPVKDVITGVGDWFCAVSAKNQHGESPNTSEIAFVAGTVPVPPTNLTIKTQ